MTSRACRGLILKFQSKTRGFVCVPLLAGNQTTSRVRVPVGLCIVAVRVIGVRKAHRPPPTFQTAQATRTASCFGC